VKRFVVGVSLLVLVAGGCSGDDSPNEPAEIANPASVYCVEQGGDLDIRTDTDGGQYGVCVFGDGTEVEEWAYFRGEAQPALP
jgi:putative hemolysin